MSRSWRALAGVAVAAGLASGCTGPMGPAGPMGAPGPAGPAGHPGPAGLSGSAGVSGYEIVVGETAVGIQSMRQLEVKCPAGKKILGAGWSILDPANGILDGTVTRSEPAFDGTGWLVNAWYQNALAPEWKLRVRLVCATMSGP